MDTVVIIETSIVTVETVERLYVTLPLNVSLDLGSECGAQHDLAMIDTDSSQSRATIGHKVGGHLDACLR